MRTTSFFALFALSFAGLISAYDPVKMLCLVNQERAASGLSPLGLSKALENAAQEHSDDQARMRSMTHNGSDGSQPSSRVERAGYDWRSVAENVAYGYGDEEECMKEWMNSPGHRQNILGSSYTHFGSAVAYSGSTPYYTQNFAGDGGYHSFPACPSGATYDTSSGGGSSPSSNYGGSAPSSDYNGGSSPSKYTSGGSSPSKYTSGGSSPTRYTSGGSAPSSNRRYTTKKRTTTYSKPVKSYGGNVQDSNTTRYGSSKPTSGHRHSNGRRYGSKKPTTSTKPSNYGSSRKPSTTYSKKPSSYGGAKPSSGSRHSSGGAYKTTTTYSKAA